MNKILLFVLSVSFSLFVYAQDSPQGFNFEIIKEMSVSPVKDQSRSGTCWSYAAVSFIEAELLRMNKGEFDLSEMYFVNHTYRNKAARYIRYHGNMNFGGGGQAHDVMDVIRVHGMVPEEAYTGLKPGEENHNHIEMDAALLAFINVIKKNPAKTLSSVWMNAFTGILDAYMGQLPVDFTYNSLKYTPASFLKMTGFKPDDYIELTSYNHHPFYTVVNLELPDNWSGGLYHNLPIDELMEVIEHALRGGYTIAWDGDVSDSGFSHREGVAVYPADSPEDLSGTERERWESMSAAERRKQMYAFTGPVSERKVEQQQRQTAFDNYTSTDDHLMHFTALVRDSNGTLYYKTKNSWGTRNNPYGGYVYMSEYYARQNTVAIMVHKNAIPKNIAKKLGI